VAIAGLAREWEKAGAEARQAAVDEVRATFRQFPVIPALKAAIAHHTGDEAWAALRPPLVALTAGQRAQLRDKLNAIGFAMPAFAPSDQVAAA
jgi:4-hydroxy-tetrahydrodipicolinate synthase